ncbi:hypothetical protein F511_24889 [Dorcoceras hygrometricum]|uniref:Uncharacterized protein n=1 Tax=Dorcoceras hygrometricum TaxID=472368 RepID=A0A2Z7A3P6_9LAMI|nr:hypothetical protein F511_24889 [Dorcoceras hygrometricum]
MVIICSYLQSQGMTSFTSHLSSQLAWRRRSPWIQPFVDTSPRNRSLVHEMCTSHAVESTCRKRILYILLLLFCSHRSIHWLIIRRGRDVYHEVHVATGDSFPDMSKSSLDRLTYLPLEFISQISPSAYWSSGYRSIPEFRT